MSSYEIRQGDVLDRLREMPDESVHMVCTSPPYWSLRDYQTGTWAGGDAECDHLQQAIGMSDKNTLGPDRYLPPTNAANVGRKLPYKDICGKCGATRIDKQLGLEATPDEFVANMVAVFREVRRVLRRDGTCWLNIGDSYAGGPSGDQGGTGQRASRTFTAATPRKDAAGLKPKDLCMIPARLALALQSDGWWIRSEITWCKRAPMPESVRDRPTSATEKIYLLTKSSSYFYDADAVREPSLPVPVSAVNKQEWLPRTKDGLARESFRMDKREYNEAGRNQWNYWLLSPDPYAEAHFATFPREIPRRAILAGTSAYGCCGACGAPHRRVVERGELVGHDRGGNYKGREVPELVKRNGGTPGLAYENKTTGWQPTCPCDAPTVPATVLDCFSGAGTTGLVAVQLGRRYIGIELNPEYIAMSEKRIHNEGAPLFSWADSNGKQAPNSQAVGSQ